VHIFEKWEIEAGQIWVKHLGISQVEDLLADGLTLRRVVDTTTHRRKYVIYQQRLEVERDGRVLMVVAVS